MLTAPPGVILDCNSQEYYVSAPFELPDGAVVSKIGWQGEVPAKTWVKAQLRFAASESELGQAVWIGPDGADSWFENEQGLPESIKMGAYVQYRLALGAVNGGSTPRVTEVSVYYKNNDCEKFSIELGVQVAKREYSKYQSGGD